MVVLGNRNYINNSSGVYKMKRKTIEQKIISDILDKGLAESTFRELHPEAYDELLCYRTDLELSVYKTLKKHKFLGK